MSDEFENGKLTVNGIALPNVNNSTIKRSSDCTDWFWITTYSNGYQTEQYLFTTCDPCTGGGGELFRYADCQSGGNSNSNSGPSYPTNPKNNELFTYLNEDGELITERYDAKEKTWKFYKIQLNQVIVVNNYKNRYDFLNRPDTNKNKPIIFEDIIYKFDWPSGSWEGESATDVAIAQAIEDQIDDSKLDPCPKEVLNKLKNTTVCDMTNVLTKLGANTIYSVKIQSGNSGGFPAQTVRNSRNDYTVTVSNDRYTSSTDLFKASNILHEIIHAFFMSLVDDYTASQNPSVFNEFPSLFQKFVDTKYPGSKEDAHHEEMANSYVDAIGSALQEFQTGVAIPNGVKPDQLYTDLAWGGLSHAPIYDKHFSNKPQEKLRIENRYRCESNGGTAGSGTPYQQTAIGKPCK